MQAMVDALHREMELSRGFIEPPIDTVYFGGGTPSLLSTHSIEGLMRALAERYPIAEDAEVTLEANPDDILPERLDAWKASGINRLSIGVQSFREEDLRWMNRAHDAAQAREAILLARGAGFGHDSIDLIYGTPGLTDADWERNIRTAIELGCPHLSCYALTVEPRTALAASGVYVDPEAQARQFLLGAEWLTLAGYEHYEISNFALPGHRSRHNSSYWQGMPYLGLGPSAHSFDGRVRRWNVSNNALYLQSIAAGAVPYEEEVLTPVQRLNEYIMTSLRTMEGLDLEKIASTWGESVRVILERKAGAYEARARMVDARMILTPEGKLFADGIAADLFFEDI
jgi:oxygen-independent coproporphyrinogen-3 oxidase